MSSSAFANAIATLELGATLSRAISKLEKQRVGTAGIRVVMDLILRLAEAVSRTSGSVITK
jgi:hypothetical protein